MAVSSFKEFTIKHKYELTKNVAYGEESGYLVTIYQNERYKLIIFPLPGIIKEEKTRVIEHLRGFSKELHIVKSYFDNTVLIVKVKEPFVQVKMEVIENILDIIVKYLKEMNISKDKNCIFCGKENSDDKIKITGIEYYMHKACYDNTLKEMEQEKNEKDKSTQPTKNYGLIGAIVGNLLVSILWVIFYGSSILPPLLMVFCGSFSIRFYQAFKGTFNKKTKYELIFANILVLILSTFIIIVRSNINILKIFDNQGLLRYLGIGWIGALISVIPLIIRLNKLEKMK